MTTREYVIHLYDEGYSVNFIVRQVYRKLNKGFFIDIKVNYFVNKKLYKNMNYCRNMVESTLLEHISTPKETQSLL